MAFQMTMEKKEDYLHFMVTGRFEMAPVQGIMEQILRDLAQTGHTKVLLDIRDLQGNPSLWERFQFSVTFAGLYLKARAQSAIPPAHFAILGDEPLVDPARFGESVARNRGLSVRVFISLEEALDWLRKAGADL